MQLPVNTFKKSLLDNQPNFGVWASFPCSATVEALTHSPYDWMLIDAEHAPLGIDTLHAQLQAVGNGACQAVVRPPACERVLVKRLLDLGVQNFMFPMIESAAMAREAVAYTRYPPLGVRGIAGATRASRYGRIDRYLEMAHQQISIVAQIESPGAVDQAHAIASVEGIDAVFIGPNDLAASLGHPGNLKHPLVVSAINDTIARVRDAGKCAGILCSSVEDAGAYLALGVNLIACGSDVRLMTRAADDMGRRLQTLRGSSHPTNAK